MSLEMIHFQKCKKWGNSKEERRTNDFTLQSACLDDSTVGAYHGHGRGLAESIIVSMMSVPASWTNGRAYHGHGHRLHHRLQHDVRVGELKGHVYHMVMVVASIVSMMSVSASWKAPELVSCLCVGSSNSFSFFLYWVHVGIRLWLLCGNTNFEKQKLKAFIWHLH